MFRGGRACMRDSIARSLATAMVRPSGSKLACATHEAIMALRTSACAAVTTYRPLLSLPSALATSASMFFCTAPPYASATRFPTLCDACHANTSCDAQGMRGAEVRAAQLWGESRGAPAS